MKDWIYYTVSFLRHFIANHFIPHKGSQMEITAIKCYVTEAADDGPEFHWRDGLQGQGHGTPAGAKCRTSHIKVETDAGYVGYAQYHRDISEIVRDRFRTLVGTDPMMTEKVWHLVWELDRLEEFNMQVLGLVDTACWDIKSQAAGLPLYQLLGGHERKVPAYASTVTWDTLDEYERMIKLCLDEGFRHFKLHAWGDLKRDAELSRALRRWAGDDADLMFDGSAGWDYVDSLRFGRVLEDLNFLWFEEPMREFDLPSYTELASNLDIPILAAETSDGCHWNAATWIQTRALDMVRTGAAYKGGITGAIKVAHLAESFGMRAQVHGGGHENLHLCAAIPNNDYYEEIVINEPDIRGLKNRTHLRIVDGFIEAPSEPGIIPHPDWEEIEKMASVVV